MSATQSVTASTSYSTRPGAWLGLALVLSTALHGALAAVLWHNTAPRSLQPETQAVAFELVRVGVDPNPEPSAPAPPALAVPVPAPTVTQPPPRAPKPTAKIAAPRASKKTTPNTAKPTSRAASASKPKRTQPSSTAKPAIAPTPPNRKRAEPSAPPVSATSAAAQRTAERAYLNALQRAIAQKQPYPASARRLGQSGVATIAFTLAADGRISQIRLAQSSGYAALDRSALQALARLGRFEPIPTALGRRIWSLQIPIRFTLEQPQ